ncbi:g5038 [Coccomyxa viridis]|uniref:G5038 protein n=1 Tax=Coccomyxa viridis TaxID=1274662 RepID=A0ABP1FWS6_9CHLO
MDNNNSLIKVTLERARIVRAQGRLDKARQLCEEANSQRLADMVKLQAAAGYPGYWPALQLLVEIELEVDIQASHLRALNRLQSFCMRQQAMLDYTTAAVNTEREAVWYKPATWVGRCTFQACGFTSNG